MQPSSFFLWRCASTHTNSLDLALYSEPLDVPLFIVITSSVPGRCPSPQHHQCFERRWKIAQVRLWDELLQENPAYSSLPKTEAGISEEELYQYRRYRWLYVRLLSSLTYHNNSTFVLDRTSLRNLKHDIADLTSMPSWMWPLRLLGVELDHVRLFFSIYSTRRSKAPRSGCLLMLARL